MKDAQAFTVVVEKGDIIVMGSDGMSDNLVSVIVPLVCDFIPQGPLTLVVPWSCHLSGRSSV